MAELRLETKIGYRFHNKQKKKRVKEREKMKRKKKQILQYFDFH